jgi:hypothetical protein
MDVGGLSLFAMVVKIDPICVSGRVMSIRGWKDWEKGKLRELIPLQLLQRCLYA